VKAFFILKLLKKSERKEGVRVRGQAKVWQNPPTANQTIEPVRDTENKRRIEGVASITS